MASAVKQFLTDEEMAKLEKPAAVSFISDADMAKLEAVHKSAPPPPSFNDERSTGQVAWDQTKAALGGIPQAVTGIPGMVSQGTDALLDALRGRGTGKAQEMVKGMAQGIAQPFMTSAKGVGALAGMAPAPTGQEWQQAAEGAGTQLGGLLLAKAPAAADSLVAALEKRIPSTARAGAKFEKVMGAAKDVPLDLTAADDTIARAQELRQRGSSFPKVFSDYVKNRKAATGDFMSQPVTEPMTYEAGRDFASNASGLSSREATALNSKMHRQVVQFSDAMKTANREAAAKVGMGDLYDQAMSEYNKAMTNAERVAVIKKWGTRFAIGTVLTGAGAGLVKEIIE